MLSLQRGTLPTKATCLVARSCGTRAPRRVLSPRAAIAKPLDLPLSWPPGPLPFAAVGFTASYFLAAFAPAAHGLFPVNYGLQFGLAIFGSMSAFQAATWVGLALHVTEGLYALRVCSQNGVPAAQTSAWTVMAFFVGFPAVLHFNSQVKRAQQAAQQ